MGEYHRVDPAEARRQRRRNKLRKRSEQSGRRRKTARRLHREVEAAEQPQRQQRLDYEAAAERVEAEQRREPEDDCARLRQRRALDRLALDFDSRREAPINRERDDREDRVGDEARAQRRRERPSVARREYRGHAARERAERAGERARNVVQREHRGQIARRGGLGQRRLLDRQEQADVAGRRIQRADHGDDEQRPEARRGRESESGQQHQRACREQHSTPAQSIGREANP